MKKQEEELQLRLSRLRLEQERRRFQFFFHSLLDRTKEGLEEVPVHCQVLQIGLQTSKGVSLFCLLGCLNGKIGRNNGPETLLIQLISTLLGRGNPATYLRVSLQIHVQAR